MDQDLDYVALQHLKQLLGVTNSWSIVEEPVFLSSPSSVSSVI